jgi:Flp pilus assembly protein TadD
VRYRHPLTSVAFLICVMAVGAQPRRLTHSRADAVRLNTLGAAYMNQQQFLRALKLFRQAAALDPALKAARTNEGIALLNLQRFNPARSVLAAVVKADPNDAPAWYNLGLLYKNQGAAEKALESFERAAHLSPSDADVFYFLGLSQAQLNRQEQAIASFRHALELSPFHASAEFGLARALQKTGEGEQAREHLARFQHLTQTKLGAPMSLAYGDQGALSLAIQAPGASRPSPTAIAVKFTDATQAAGLQFSAATAEQKEGAAELGSGACFFDLENDGKPDLLVADHGPQGGLAIFHNTGSGRFEDITEKSGLDGKLQATACAAGDYDNDGHTDIALTVAGKMLLFRNQGNGTFQDVTNSAGLAPGKSALSLAFIDYDHDGDLDLLISGMEPGTNVLWRNNGNGKFTDATVEAGMAGNASTYGIAGTDFNNDRAIDLVFAAEKPSLLVNPREGKWTASESWSKSQLAPVVSTAVLDFDKDGWMDIAFTHAGVPGITLWRNLKGRGVEQVKLPIEGWRKAWGVTALDYDNDGWIDLAAVGEREDGTPEIRLLRNLGPAGFRDVTKETGLSAIKLTSPRSLQGVDFDDDGDMDLLITQEHGPAMLLRNDGGNRNNFLRVALTGLNDNKSAVGTKVEVFAGGIWQKWEIGGYGYLSQSSTGLLAGVGKERRIDTVRMLWPTGVVQDETELASNSLRKINEIDRRGSSCPVLFVWDGKRYRFVADMIGSGVVGHWVGPGEHNIPDSTEYIKIEGSWVQPRNGWISMRFMEPLEEVVYLDQARLLAVDHPAGLDVYPNEYFASNPPFPEFKVITSRKPLPLAGAWDDQDRDVLSLLRDRDHRYVAGFELLPYKGFTRLHSLRIELPHAYAGGSLRLLMHGYIEYFFANSMYAAWQAGINPVAPYVEALGQDGKWVRVVEDMGFPAGLPRATVADLTGKLPAGTRQLRITTNLQIYWDQILVDTTTDSHEMFRITDLSLGNAELAFHGYPRMIEGASPGDLQFVYEDASPTGPYARPIGAYTRAGNVRALLSTADDRFVVFGSGDEVRMEFNVAGLPPLPTGWKRDYFFFADGYEKDMDFYASAGDSVAPLPFHQMSHYPYEDNQYPQDDVHVNDLLNFDTRFFSDMAVSSYRFQYPERKQIKPTGKPQHGGKIR